MNLPTYRSCMRPTIDPASLWIICLALGGLLGSPSLSAQSVTGRSIPFDIDGDGTDDFALNHQFVASPTPVGATINYRISLQPLGANSILAAKDIGPNNSAVTPWVLLGTAWTGVPPADQRLVAAADTPDGVNLVHNTFFVGGPFPNPGTGQLLGSLPDGTNNYGVLLTLGAGEGMRPAWISFRARAESTVSLVPTGFGFARSPGASAVTGHESVFFPIRVSLLADRPTVSRHPLAADAAVVNDFIFESRSDLGAAEWTLIDPAQPLDDTAPQLFIRWRLR